MRIVASKHEEASLDDETWNSVLQSMTAPEPVAAEPVIETAAPEADVSLTTETVSEPVIQEPASDPQIVASVPETVETTPPAPPPIDWEHPDLKPISEKAKKLEQLEQALAEQQRVRAAQQTQADIEELAEGDAERHQKLVGVISKFTTPLQQQAQNAEQRAHFSEKQATALLIALKAELSEDQFSPIFARYGALMELEGPEVMEKIAYADRDAKRQWSQERSTYESQIAELRQQLAATQEVVGRGAADLVDGGTGVAAESRSREDRMRSATTFDDYWAGMTGQPQRVNPNAA